MGEDDPWALSLNSVPLNAISISDSPSLLSLAHSHTFLRYSFFTHSSLLLQFSLFFAIPSLNLRFHSSTLLTSSHNSKKRKNGDRIKRKMIFGSKMLSPLQKISDPNLAFTPTTHSYNVLLNKKSQDNR